MILRKGFVRLITLVMSIAVVLSVGCSKKESGGKSKMSGPSSSVTETSAYETTTETTPDTSSETTEETTKESTSAADSLPSDVPSPRSKSSFTEYLPCVLSPMTREMMTPEQQDVYYRFCEAVLAEEETFEFNDFKDLEHVYHSVVRACCPYAYLVATIPDSWNVSGNTIKIIYKGDREWRKSKYDELKNAVEDLLQNVLKEEYSDFENALALYEYFTRNFVYDYDKNGADPDYLGAYIALIKKTGVCQHFSLAYNFVLQQTGCDVELMSGEMDPTYVSSHEWNILRLDGKCYMVDTTWDLGKGKLKYFLFTMEERQENNYFSTKVNVGTGYHDYEGEYLCNDERYTDLHKAEGYTWNPDDNTITLLKKDGNGNMVEYQTFKYE